MIFIFKNLQILGTIIKVSERPETEKQPALVIREASFHEFKIQFENLYPDEKFPFDAIEATDKYYYCSVD